MDDILIRNIVRRIKRIESLRIPNYQLPSDSSLERLAKDIVLMVNDYLLMKESYGKENNMA